MQIVIDIPDERYADIKRIASVQLDCRFETVEQIISKGTPLPEGHGRLIDANAFSGEMFCRANLSRADICYDSIRKLLDEEPTIIEADRGKENDA